MWAADNTPEFETFLTSTCAFILDPFAPSFPLLKNKNGRILIHLLRAGAEAISISSPPGVSRGKGFWGGGFQAEYDTQA